MLLMNMNNLKSYMWAPIQITPIGLCLTLSCMVYTTVDRYLEAFCFEIWRYECKMAEKRQDTTGTSGTVLTKPDRVQKRDMTKYGVFNIFFHPRF